MRSFREVRLGLSFVGLLALAGILVPGCGKQGEGLRCDYDVDCEDGLSCSKSTKVCCPPSGGTGLCAEGAVIETDAGTDTGTVDTGTTDTGTADTGSSETATDSGAADTETDTGSTAADAADAG